MPTQSVPASTLLYLNPFSSWDSSSNEENFNQIVSFETYQRLVKQEMNELHSLANSSAANTKDHFQQYYHNLSQGETNELKVYFKKNKIAWVIDYKLSIIFAIRA